MRTEKSVICGKHIKIIRRYLGLTQEEFGRKLGEWGITDKTGNLGKAPEIVASWESGRNQVPNSVLHAIYENVSFKGNKIQWAYLVGESDYITQDIDGILTHLFNADSPSSKGEFEKLKESEIVEIANSRINKLALLLEESLLPLYNHSKTDFFDYGRFVRKINTVLQNEIESFIIDEEKGK